MFSAFAATRPMAEMLADSRPMAERSTSRQVSARAESRARKGKAEQGKASPGPAGPVDQPCSCAGLRVSDSRTSKRSVDRRSLRRARCQNMEAFVSFDAPSFCPSIRPCVPRSAPEFRNELKHKINNNFQDKRLPVFDIERTRFCASKAVAISKSTNGRVRTSALRNKMT